MTYLWVLGLLLVIGFFLYKSTRPKPLLTVKIRIHADGRYEVVAPSDAASRELLPILALCYLAKLRWLLVSEPEGVTEATKLLIREVVENWPESSGAMIPDLPYAGQIIREYGRGDWTVKEEEAFTVGLFFGSNVGYYVQNTLPYPIKKSNYPWNYIVLLDHLSKVLDGESRSRFHEALGSLFPTLFGRSAHGGAKELMTFNKFANIAWDGTEPSLEGDVDSSDAQTGDSDEGELAPNPWTPSD